MKMLSEFLEDGVERADCTSCEVGCKDSCEINCFHSLWL